jgi:peptidoglycan/LPS O-acetylase OafA/YrhL
MKEKRYFNNLDSLRFFSFLAIFFFHIFYSSDFLNYKVYAFLHHFFKNGDLGVNFFFTLSGFLITYHLLNEEKEAGSFNLKHFYIRRILRIWPLYYVTFLFGYFLFHYLIKIVMGGLPETANPWLYVFFLGNFNSIINGDPTSSTLSVLWSIAIEEQFYLVWPILLLLVKKHRQLLFLLIVISSLIFRAYHLNNHTTLFYHTLSVMSDLSIGGWLAYLALNNQLIDVAPGHKQKYISAIVYASLLCLIVYREELVAIPSILVFERVLFSLFFAYILYEQACLKHPPIGAQRFSFAHKWGKYTYALYCLHIPAMVFTEGAALALGIEKTHYWLVLGRPASTLLLSMLMSRASYYMIERPFLRLKPAG